MIVLTAVQTERVAASPESAAANHANVTVARKEQKDARRSAVQIMLMRSQNLLMRTLARRNAARNSVFKAFALVRFILA